MVEDNWEQIQGAEMAAPHAPVIRGNHPKTVHLLTMRDWSATDLVILCVIIDTGMQSQTLIILHWSLKRVSKVSTIQKR